MTGRATKELARVSRRERAEWAAESVVALARRIAICPTDTTLHTALRSRLVELDAIRSRLDGWRGGRNPDAL